MKNRLLTAVVAVVMVLSLTACGANANQEIGNQAEKKAEMELQVFIAASLSSVMTELADCYTEMHPEVSITYNADSSGTLATQIEEGYECDIFFPAAQKQMDQLEADGLIIEETRKNVVNNQVVVISRKDSKTRVTGLENLSEAESIALAGGSVPVGRYTRQAMMNLGMFGNAEDSCVDLVTEPEKITAEQVSEVLGGVEINEQDNVSKVLMAVIEGSCEVGTTYYSDIYGYEKELNIMETVSQELTGDVSYPIALVVNEEADEIQRKAAEDFMEYLLSEEAKAIFEKYYFDTEVE